MEDEQIFTGGGPLREIDAERPFERDLRDCFEGKVKDSDVFAADLWGAMANVTWSHPEHGAVGYTFRAAGDVVAALRGEGDYCDWYCSTADGHVPAEVSVKMAERGWSWSLD